MRNESSYETAFGKQILGWASEQGLKLEYLKFTVPGRKGWPDRLIIWGPEFHMLFIEWKQPGEKPRPLQNEIHAQLRAMGAEVQVHDNGKLAMEEVTNYIVSKAGTDSGHEAHSGGTRDAPVSPSRQRKNCYRSKGFRRVEEVRDGRCAACTRTLEGCDYELAEPDGDVVRL